ncbi:ChaN family lipoprotein [Pseudodonghicola xiamenensis]|uniref:Haem-binding uptake Tiki superfamily ChaN domain-containing protein n=1 Tax=Pseudodonghicola xiamenensis TaxID=337702 RepID=A0A8J3H7Q2_9RHOB|nr:ChaN family lipoprotein [Pseudodonghicola xiamenensis]GHG88475.1 hypothetical protein GCM10010961_17580 [Pseudodonghicola xiamenensis]
MRKLLGAFALILSATPLWGASLSDQMPADALAAMRAADVVFLGELHDNPAHHQIQAEAVAVIRPKALVWEMMTADIAATVDPAVIADPEALERLTGWATSGWPPLADYLPVFRSVGEARHYGALIPRQALGQVIAEGAVAAFGPETGRFGLALPLPADEQAAREADQQAAHCGAMPADKLGLMVDIQRLRDATLARTALQALAETGGPVVVISGNGHARRDRGVPLYLLRAAPETKVFALGQAEAGRIEGSFDAVVDSPAVDRPDPCAVFTKS